MKTKLSRRSILRASGISIALPFLEAMQHASGAQVQDAPKRMLLICNTLGLHPPSLFPKQTGDAYQATEYLKILESHRRDLTLFSGLSHPDQNGKQPHDTEMTWLTAAKNPGLAGFKNSISVDQLAASKVGAATRFPSIGLSTHTKKSQSYNVNGVMIPAEDKPSVLFAKLFLKGSESEVARERQKLSDGQSVLDAVANQTRSLSGKISADDQHRLDSYFEAIREAERELVLAEQWLDRPKPVVRDEQPDDVSDQADLIGRTQALFSMIPLILRSDSSRVISLVIQDHLVVPKIAGVSAEHHNLSHHGQDPEKIRQLKRIESGLLASFGELLSELSCQDELGLRLLDSTTVLFGSNLGNANAHDPRNLPILLAGGGMKHGKHVAYDAQRNTPLCNLFLSLLQRMGVEQDQFASSTGVLTI